MASKAVNHLFQAESFAKQADETISYNNYRLAQIYTELAKAHAQIAIAYKTITG